MAGTGGTGKRGRRTTIRGYAESRGVSHTAVRRAIARGILREGAGQDENGTWWVEPLVADGEWEAGALPTKRRENAAAGVQGRRAARRRTKVDEDGHPEPDLDEVLAPDPAVAARIAKGGDDLAWLEDELISARGSPAKMLAIKLEIESRTKALELLERRGQLTERAKEFDAGVVVGRVVRDAILRIGPRISGKLARLTSEHEIEVLLEDVHIKALEALCRDGAPD